MKNTKVLITGAGFWGIGNNDAEAIINAKLSKGANALRMECPEGTRVNEMGGVSYPKGGEPTEFVHGKIGGTKVLPTFIPME